MDVKMPIKNNVTRLLESRKIPFAAFELPSEKLGAVETARLLEIDPATVYKTIVVTREKSGGKKPLLVVIPGPNQVDLKALAAFLGEKKVYLPTQREAENLTGLQAGGISPLALLNKGFQVVLDALARKQAEIHVSGGQRGLNIRLPVEDFIRVTSAKVASVSRPEDV
jgi:Cys-tRNA(Pro)/Cys-tRNA(Cys) deacylase